MCGFLCLRSSVQARAAPAWPRHGFGSSAAAGSLRRDPLRRKRCRGCLRVKSAEAPAFPHKKVGRRGTADSAEQIFGKPLTIGGICDIIDSCDGVERNFNFTERRRDRVRVRGGSFIRSDYTTEKTTCQGRLFSSPKKRQRQSHTTARMRSRSASVKPSAASRIT